MYSTKIAVDLAPAAGSSEANLGKALFEEWILGKVVGSVCRIGICGGSWRKMSLRGRGSRNCGIRFIARVGFAFDRMWDDADGDGIF